MADPKNDGAMARFFRGASYFGRGLGFVFGERGLWPWVVAPTLLTTAVTVGLSVFAYRWADAFIAAHTAGHGAFVAFFIKLFLFLFVLAAGFVAFLVTSLVASAPFAGPLTARVESRVTGVGPPKGSVGESLRALGATLVSVAIYMLLAGAIVLLQLVVSPLAPFLGILGFCVTAKFLAFDNLDFPLSRRLKTFGEKWDWIGRHRAETNGFGAVVALLSFVPGFGLLVPTVAAAGATLLYLDLERAAPKPLADG